MSPTPESSPRGRFAPGLALIAVLAFAGRILYLVTSKVDRTSTIHQGDAFWYSSVAWATAKGHVLTNPFFGGPTADHPPLTVVVLLPVARLFPQSTWAMRLTMVVIGTLAVVVVGLAGRRLAGPRVGLASAAVAALLPALWVNDVLIMSEAPTALAVAGILYLAIALGQRPRLRLAAAAGAVCGLAALARAETVLYLPLLIWPVLALARTLGWRQRLGRVALASGATLLVLAPWTLFNLTRFDEPVTMSTNDGLTFLGANCDGTYHGRILGGWLIEPCLQDFWDTLDDRKPPGPATFPDGEECPDTSQHRPPCWDPSTVSRLMRAEGLHYVRTHLTDVPFVVLARNGRVWGVYQLEQGIGIGPFEGRPTGVGRAGFVALWVMLPVCILGAVVLRRHRISLLPFGSSLLIVVVVTSAFYGLVRFRIPWDVASCLLAGVAVAAALERLGISGPAIEVPEPPAAPSPPEPPPSREPAGVGGAPPSPTG